MITLEKYIAGVISRGERQKLARILTYLKMGFGSAFVRGGGPTEASKYTRMELEEFDPVVSSVVAQPGDPMWILVMDHEIWVYKRTNDEWDQFTRGAAGNFKLSGSDRLVMNHFIEFVLSVFDSTGKISNAELIQRMLKGNYIIDIDLLTPAYPGPMYRLV